VQHAAQLAAAAIAKLRLCSRGTNCSSSRAALHQLGYGRPQVLVWSPPSCSQ
jgi:hypothetical protein